MKVLPDWRLVSPGRYDLDACDIQEKYPDLFQVNLEVEVEPRDRPSREAPPWESTSMRGLNPKILFSSREEQQDILSKFGEILVFQTHSRWWCRHGKLLGAGLAPIPVSSCALAYGGPEPPLGTFPDTSFHA